MSESPASLRARAAGLDAAAWSLGTSEALVVHRLAGPDTWRGPTADRCRTDLQMVRTRLLVATRELQHQARVLRLTADSLETGGR
jgi:hypothetical protein